jgi:hypothetical protein
MKNGAEWGSTLDGGQIFILDKFGSGARGIILVLCGQVIFVKVEQLDK